MPSPRTNVAGSRFRIVLTAVAAGVTALVGGQGLTESASGSSRVRAQGAVTNIYVVNVRTRALTRVTRNRTGPEEKLAYDPSWSPDGRRLAFTQTPCHFCSSEIHVTRVRPPAQRWLTPRLAYGSRPRWSPDGRRIAFVGVKRGIYTMATDGSDVRLLVAGGLSNDEPSWSPDGRRIAFARQESASVWHIYVINANRTGLTRLTRGNLQAISPAWSPNGRRIAFVVRERTGSWQIYSMSVDGSDRRRISDGRGSDTAPTWSPDGRHLAFVRQTGSSTALYVMNANAIGIRRLTAETLNAVHPQWSPQGAEIAFAARQR